ncbi:MAG: hypothetical protein GWO16_08350 [Gammaproteobacteria bacterium]|nr:hypothetical protein [Gammaproteobacteria bacterium]NIR97958.1 hypothetical protein [Gammaproteobacteria bacterium]NIT63659.1 hypothetical protein [Gammaproteobacteria bacterium]NIV21517.1 hypothetical protein [Gammaproteobacteria bacterium]NIY32239.1 hypothetical protein [Gammaproteobacteria bacterium]
MIGAAAAADPLSPGYQLGRWLYLHPNARRLPGHIEQAARAAERHQLARRIHLSQARYELAQKIKALEEADGLARAERRAIERRVADYIEQHIAPLAEGDRTLRELPEHLRACRTTGALGIRPDQSHLVAWDAKCGQAKLCPDEAREEAHRIQRAYIPELLRQVKEGRDTRIYYAVLTMPNVAPGKLHQAKRAMFRRFRALLRKRARGRRRFSEITGALVTQEDPMGADGAWNVHLNAVLVVEGWLDYRELREAWHWNVELKRVRAPTVEALARTLRELVKYPVRMVAEKSQAKAAEGSAAPPMLEWAPTKWLEWWYANKGFRRTRSYGCLYAIQQDEEGAGALEDVEWIGTVAYRAGGYHVTLGRPPLDLIPDHKSTTSGAPGGPREPTTDPPGPSRPAPPD